jgi:uncharacterized protein YdgA (DUF945 family)
MKKIAWVAVPLLVIAAAAGAGPWYAGMRAEQALRANAESFGTDKQSPLAISYTRFERGWRNSRAVTRVALKADPAVYFDVQHEISHMPDRESWMRVRSVPQISGAMKANLDYYFGGQAPLVIDTVIGYDGSRVTQFTSPAFSKPLHQRPETTVSWGGLHGQLRVDAGDRWVGSATLPSLVVEGGDTQMILTGMKIDGAWTVHGAAIDWEGETKVGVAECKFITPLQQFAIRDFGVAGYQRSKGNSVTLGYALRIGSGSAVEAGAAGQTINNLVLELELDKLDKPALAKYLSDLSNAEKLIVAPEVRTRLAAQLVMNLAGELLRGSPEMRIKQVGVETPAGSVLAHATVSFDGTNLPAAAFSPEMLSRIKAKADVKMSGTLLRTQLQQQLRSKVEVALRQQGGIGTEENIRAMSEKATEEQLKGFTDAGLLRASGPDFTIEAEFAQGRILVNGMPANQLFGGMFAAPAPALPQEKPPEHEAAAPARYAPLALAGSR